MRGKVRLSGFSFWVNLGYRVLVLRVNLGYLVLVFRVNLGFQVLVFRVNLGYQVLVGLREKFPDVPGGAWLKTCVTLYLYILYI